VVAAAVVEELQLLVWGEELTRREEALITREEKITEKALVKVSVDLDAEWAKIEATLLEYLNKMCAHTTYAKHTLSLNKMLGEKKVLLDKTKQDLSMFEVALMEA
jgi:hypothetical protein